MTTFPSAVTQTRGLNYFAFHIKEVVSEFDILGCVSQEALLKYYFQVTCPSLICSPLRVDKHPSFKIFYDKMANICFKDFSTGQGGNIFKMISLYFGLPLQETLYKIKQDIPKIFPIENVLVRTTRFKSPIKKKNSNTTIVVKLREWVKHDLEWWKQYGIDKNFLEFCRVYPIERFLLNGVLYIADLYAYCYLEKKDGVDTYKLYQPFSNSLKWLTNHNNSVWGLWSQCMAEDGDICIITSSVKDSMVVWKHLGIPSTSLQGEMYIPKKQVMAQLKHRFKTVIIWYDTDDTGERASKKLAEMFDLKWVQIPKEYETKDQSDFYKKYGKKQFKQLWLDLSKGFI